MRQLFASPLQITLLLIVIAASPGNANGQSDRRRRDDAPSPRALESRVEKAEESLVGEYKEVAEEFYRQGDREKAIALLKRLNSLNPTMPGLKDEIQKIQNELLEENPGELTFDTRKQVWLPVGRVQKGKPVRLQCTGEYKLTLSTTLMADGMNKPTRAVQATTTSPKKRGGQSDKSQRTQEDIHFVENLPLGCLAGVIVDGTKLGEPFKIGAQTSLNPKSDGILIVKTNLPQGVRCTGKLELTFSGYIDTQSK